MNPEIIAFHASSFCLHPFTAQSNVENIPPHTPKLPPVTGALAFMEEMAPTKRAPYAFSGTGHSLENPHTHYITTHPR